MDINNYVLDTILSKLQKSNVHSTLAEDAKNSCTALSAAENLLDFKCYDVYHVGTEGIVEYCIQLEAELLQLGAIFKYQHHLLDIEKFDNIFVATVKDKRGEMLRLSSDTIVVATGKSSGFLLRSLMEKLGVRYEYNAIELGIRVETVREGITALSETHLDAKIKNRMGDDVEVRTFCMCDGGYLVNCYYDSYLKSEKITTISGFSFREKKSQNANFGILVRKKFPEGLDPLSVQIGIIQAMNKAAKNKGTIVQRYEDFVKNRPTQQDMLAKNHVQSTLPDVTPVNLRWLLPEYVTSAVEDFLQRLSLFASNLIIDDTLLHAPVWELCWDRVIAGEGLSTTVPGFYVAGDALGWARGIVQAASTGIFVARDILSQRVPVAVTKTYP
ncbi:MAG TPA: hypothetical protein VFV38_14765 [Ktedonobacteraceae bacterium]|nr:hypothetical protein [Ktedonobacteraceae bacterium]